MKNYTKYFLLFAATCLCISAEAATVTWNPNATDVATLVAKNNVTVGTGSESFKLYAARPLSGNNNEVKLAMDGTSVKCTDNGMDKAGIAVFIPTGSATVTGITFYMHTSNSRKTYYATYSGSGSFPSATVTGSVLEKTSTPYNFWTTFTSGNYYIAGGRSGGSGDVFIDKIEVTFGTGGGTNPPGPSTVAVTGVTLNTTTASLTVGQNTTLTATVAPANATNQAVSWSSSNTAVATVNNGVVTAVAAGTATITVTTADGNKTATCAVTVTAGSNPPTTVAVTGVTLNPTTASLTVGQNTTLTATVAPANATNQAVSWSSSNTAVATVNNGVVTAVAAGTATITVTTADGNKTATCAVTVTAGSNPPVTPPSTTLTLHEPDIYDAPRFEGGYNTPYVRYNNRDWEVYYTGRPKNASGDRVAGVVTQYNQNGSNEDDRYAGYTVSNADATTTECHAADGWFRANIDALSSAGLGANAEFAGATGQWRFKSESHYLELHIKGYDQFDIYALDKKSNGDDYSKPADIKHFEVYVDGVKQPCTQLSTSASVRTYPISTGEHVIKVTAIGNDQSQLYGFALRPAFVPRIKYIDGNDSTQRVRQTQNIAPITYYLKNKISAATLTWNGATATGITLQEGMNDTLTLQGTANCPSGTYQYTISAKDAAGAVVTSMTGKLTVYSEIRAMGDTIVTAFIRSAITPIDFRYYAVNEADVTFSWTGATPTGMQFTKNHANHTASISGTPTTIGTYPFQVTVAGGNTITGKVITEDNRPTIVPGATKTCLYLYKTNKTGLLDELKTKYNYFARPAAARLLNTSDYNEYDFIVISEDVDATNPEVLDIIKSLNKPVLNQKAFTYSPSRLGWGNPDNGSINNTSVKVRISDHPIFTGFRSESIQVIDSVYNARGLMPIDIFSSEGYALGLAKTRGEEYTEDGDYATLIHEYPAERRGGAKYLSLPIGTQSAAHLTTDGKKLLHNMINYLLSRDAYSSTVGDLRITSFSIEGYPGEINEAKNLISLVLPADLEAQIDHLTPVITLADPVNSIVTPGSGETVDFSDQHYGVTFTVSNFIKKRNYTVIVKVKTALEDLLVDTLWLEGHYLHNDANTWVNIFTVGGHLVTTTNSDFDFDTLPQGLYLVVTDHGTLKVIR